MATERNLPSELSESAERLLAEAVKGSIATSDVAHGWTHISEVVRLSKWILLEVRANRKIVIGAAFCHDLQPRGAISTFGSAADRSAEDCRPLLLRIGYSATEVAQVQQCIRTGSWEHFLAGGSPCCLEAEILRDADWLDAMGAHGIARVFAFAGHNHCDLSYPIGVSVEAPRRLPTAPDRPDPSPFYHFFSKLLWLKGNLTTIPAIREAEKRHDFMLSFLRCYEEEMRLASVHCL